jgi:ComF family protein
MNSIEWLVNLIAPHECVGCLAEDSLLCVSCRQTLPPIVDHCYRCGRTDRGVRTCKACRSSSSLYELFAATTYSAEAKLLVRGMKYERQRAAYAPIAQALYAKLAEQLPPTVLVTHIPTAPQRVRRRGYDQAELIAKALANKLNLAYAPLLSRQGQQRQVGERRQVRLQQMSTAFRTKNAHLVPQSHILLVDDVITTGATLEAAADVLHQAGAKRISAAVFAAA